MTQFRLTEMQNGDYAKKTGVFIGSGCFYNNFFQFEWNRVILIKKINFSINGLETSFRVTRVVGEMIVVTSPSTYQGEGFEGEVEI